MVYPVDQVIDEELTVTEEPMVVQPMAIGIPCYHTIPAAFFANFVSLTGVQDCPVQVVHGVYTPQAMRSIIMSLLKIPEWKRVLILEQDMICPPDTILKHAMHTDPVVGSVYFQHAPPHHCNVMIQHPTLGNTAHLKPIGIATMLQKPALYKVDVVGMGCTSIRRDVFENWPADLPFFRNAFEDSAINDEFTQGEVSHDVWFCKEVRKQGYDIYLDSSIICQHLTEGSIGPQHYLGYHQEELANQTTHSPIVLPNRSERRRLGRLGAHASDPVRQGPR